LSEFVFTKFSVITLGLDVKRLNIAYKLSNWVKLLRRNHGINNNNIELNYCDAIHINTHEIVCVCVCVCVCTRACVSNSLHQLSFKLQTVLVYSGERPYHCGACGQRYTQGHLLKAHIRSRHGSEMAYYNMDKRSDGVRCRRALNAIRAAAAAHTTVPGASPQTHHGPSANGAGAGSGIKEDKIRFLLEAAEASRNNQHQQLQHHPAVSGPLTTALVPQGPMAGTGPFGGMSLGQYVTALSNCLPQQHQQHPVPISGSSIIGPQSGFVRGPLIWTPSMNMSLAAAAASAGLVGGPAAAAAAAAFQSSQRQQQQFQNQQRSSTTSDAGLAMTSHAALLSSLAATPFQPTSGHDSVDQKRSAVVMSASVQRTTATTDSSLLSSLLQTAPYGGAGMIGNAGLRFALPSASATNESSSSPSRRRGRTSYSDRQSPEDLSTGGSRRRVEDDDHEQAVAAATSMMTPMMMMSFLSNHKRQMTNSPSPVDRRLVNEHSTVASRPEDGRGTPSNAEGALNLVATSATSPYDGSASHRTQSAKAADRHGENGSTKNGGEKERMETEATDLSARSGNKRACNLSDKMQNSHASRSPTTPAAVQRRSSPVISASALQTDDVEVTGTELDLSQSKVRQEQPETLPKIAEDDDYDDRSSSSSSSGSENYLQRSSTRDKLITSVKNKKMARDVTSCCASTDPSIGGAVCPHLTKLRQLRRNVYRMLSVFTPYLDVAGVGGVADVEADSVDDFLHEVIYSSKLGTSSQSSSK